MKLKKMFCVVLIIVLSGVLGILSTGCNSKKKVDNTVEDTKNLWIYVIDKGYGTDWIYAMEKGFEAKHPGIDVHVTTNPLQEMLLNTFISGPEYNDYDLYFDVSGGNSAMLYDEYLNDFKGYESGLYDLSEIYATQIPGEDKTLEAKLMEGVSEFIKIDRKDVNGYYTIPWATSVMGICYNADVFSDAFGAEWQKKLPNTTLELETLCAELLGKGYTPFVYPGQLDYWSTTSLYTWWAQYEGVQNYNNFYNGLVYNRDEDAWILDKAVYSQQGRKEALEALGSLLDQDKNFHPDTVNDYNVNNFRTLQVRFLTREQKIAMYPCGDWLEQESADARSSEFGMMKMPIISSLSDKLTSIDKSTPQSADRDLSELVGYVDGTITTLSKDYSETDIEIVRNARSISISKASIQFGFVPSYSNAKALVKDFLLYFASDEGIRIFKENVGGGFLPFRYQYDKTNFSLFEKSMSNILDKATLIVNNPNDAITNSRFDFDEGTAESLLGAKHSSAYYRTAEQLFQKAIPTDAEWEIIKSNAGVLN